MPTECPQGQWQSEPPDKWGWYWVLHGGTMEAACHEPDFPKLNRQPPGALWWSEPIQAPPELEECGSPTERPWLRYEREIAQAIYPRIHAWIEAGMPPAQTAFTEGLERVVAQLCEEAVRAEDQENRPAGG